MRVITHEALIERNRRIANFSFFFSLIAVLVAFLFSNSLPGNNETSIYSLQCTVLLLMMLVIFFSVRMGNNWIRPPLAWEALQEALRGTSSQATLYHFVFPARHVLITPTGVYVLYPMFQDRHIVVRDDKWFMPGGLFGKILTVMRQEAVGNPTHEAQVEAEALQKLLDEQFPGHTVQVKPVIVFTHPKAHVEIEGELTVPVAFASANREPSLKDFLRMQKDQGQAGLTPEQVETLDNIFIYV